MPVQMYQLLPSPGPTPPSPQEPTL